MQQHNEHLSIILMTVHNNTNYWLSGLLSITQNSKAGRQSLGPVSKIVFLILQTTGGFTNLKPVNSELTEHLQHKKKKNYPHNRPWRLIGLQTPQCLDNRITYSSEVVSLRERVKPQGLVRLE
jgi:hypothetical protein